MLLFLSFLLNDRSAYRHRYRRHRHYVPSMKSKTKTKTTIRNNRTSIWSFLLLLTLSTTTSAMALSLQGKRVLVTGGGRGIGQAIALICQREGAKVAITSRTESELRETAELARTTTKTKTDSACDVTSSTSSSLLYEISTHVTDVTNPSQVKELMQQLIRQWDGIDILVNNAGMAQNPKGPIQTISTLFNDNDDNENDAGATDDDNISSSEYFSKLLQLNVVALHTVTSTMLSLGAMKTNKKQDTKEAAAAATKTNDNDNNPTKEIVGHILNISSKAGKVGLANYSLYVASKFAVEGLTSSWSKELHASNIIVNSLSPGMVHTKSFPKNPPTKSGVRTALSIKDCLLLVLTQTTMDYTGCYIHVDELDTVRSKGLPDETAWKRIDEIPFQSTSTLT